MNQRRPTRREQALAEPQPGMDTNSMLQQLTALYGLQQAQQADPLKLQASRAALEEGGLQNQALQRTLAAGGPEAEVAKVRAVTESAKLGPVLQNAAINQKPLGPEYMQPYLDANFPAVGQAQQQSQYADLMTRYAELQKQMQAQQGAPHGASPLDRVNDRAARSAGSVGMPLWMQLPYVLGN